MALHLIKLSVGSESLADLETWQQRRLSEKQRKGQQTELIHITRRMPKRAEELLADGSIYWVIKGFVCARQRLLALREMDWQGVPHCGIVYEPTLIRVRARPHRPFQGWRYLQANDAPPDLVPGEIDPDMPESLQRELAALGLL